MCRSLARMIREQPQQRGRQAPSLHGTRGGGASDDVSSVTGTGDLEGLRPPEPDQVPEAPPTWTSNGYQDQDWWGRDQWWDWGNYGYRNWQMQPWSNRWDQSQHWSRTARGHSEIVEEEDDMVNILPDPVLGWFLLEKSGLDVLERSVIQGEIKGQFSLRSVENALRSHWNDDQLRKRDGEVRHGAQYQDDDIDQDEEPMDMDEDAMAQWTEDEKAWFYDAKAEEHQAWMQLQQARRTLREARTRQHDIKMSRRFYRPGSSPNPGKSFPKMNNQGNQGTRGAVREGPCFNCGAMGHKAAACPKKRKENAQMVDEPDVWRNSPTTRRSRTRRHL